MAMESDDKYLRPRYLSVLERLETAVCHSGRRKEDVTLVAVSKLHPASMVAAVCDLGQIDSAKITSRKPWKSARR